MKHAPWVVAFLAGIATAAAVGSHAGSHATGANTVLAAQTAPVSVPVATPGTPARALPDFSDLVEKNGPAVVNISVHAMEKVSDLEEGGDADDGDDNSGAPDSDDPFFRFFRHFGAGQGQNPHADGKVPVEGTGSGFIVSADGIIYTNAHVVDGATEVMVKLTDGREFKAKVVGSDKLSDVAVLKINATHLPVLQLDRADDVKVGQWVVAIGSPYGFENSVTAGIVSAKARSLPDETYVPFIQTDAAVNPGNSGGPLFNMKGEVIGINAQIYSRSGGYQGLSFAIPIDVVLNVGDQILHRGGVSRGKIGVGIQDVNQALADSFGLERPSGALVSSVEPDGPAARAGIKTGDVITAFNGHAIPSSTVLPALVAMAPPGSSAQVDIVRGGKRQQLQMTVGELKVRKDTAAAEPAGTPVRGKLGVVVRPLNGDEQDAAGASSGGVEVEQVAGAAARAGIRPGDVILALNNVRVQSPLQLQNLVAHIGKHFAILIQRDGNTMYVPVDLG